jgi:hypothetical protein
MAVEFWKLQEKNEVAGKITGEGEGIKEQITYEKVK